MINLLEKDEDEIYKSLTPKIIDVIYDHFPEGYPTDFLKIAKQLGYAYFVTIAAQLSIDPELGKILTPVKIQAMSTHLMNTIGHMLSVEGVAEPATTEE